MDSGIRLEHFGLLEQYGGAPWTRTADQVAARDRLREPYKATKAWAEALQVKLFPDGRTDGRMAVINQGQHFSRYTWWRIYPRKSSPHELAYTVGIDCSGEFIVKLDTYQAAAPVHAAYVAESGPTIAASPFAAVMSAEEGVNLSFEALIDWSIAAIADFYPGYEELANRIGLAQTRLRLVIDPHVTRRQLDRWRAAVLEGSIARKGIRWVPDSPFVVRVVKAPDGRIRTELGHDPSGKNWTVEINEARQTGNPNSLSAVAVDAQGRSYLLRQGLLRKNGETEKGVSPSAFASRTGLTPVNVEVSPTGIERAWFLVAALEEKSDLIRKMTGRFVRACALARSTRSPAPTAEDVGYRLGADEKGGTYVIGSTGPQDEKIVSRKQGFVWLALQERLLERDIKIEKPGHSLGYEVDATVKRPGKRPLLIEIKTGATAADIHTGAGQLHLYPALIPAIAGHERILLLPGRPHEDVVAALAKLDIVVFTYDPGIEPDGSGIRFTSDFLELCGLD
ncbi:hypothetical protein [Mesorhizobium sp. WSM3626]|uniref:hypothetical protein n=1 Tax=Mesorhizobium sp. WSM3626 TaxID=1040987 RepID=UPI000486939C|nr:hypothetical protein [Mesorhizobium sp. WSM3626]